MIRINLLPYREAQRKAAQRRNAIGAAIGAALVGLMFYGIHGAFEERIEHQQARVDYLKQEVALVDAKIKTISELKEKRETMLERLRVVEELQKDRSQMVRVFNEVGTLMPSGIFLTHLQQNPQGFLLEGFAESNGQVSELMRRLEGSAVFANPRLEIISKTELAGLPVGQFKMLVGLRAGEQETPKLQQVAMNGGAEK